MSTEQLTLEVKVTELDIVKELIDCLKENYADLPSAVQHVIDKLSEK